jgi:hypothetical protein
MIIVRLKGGLGNQMFQYAYGRSLNAAGSHELFLDRSLLNTDFPLPGETPRNFELDAFRIDHKFLENPDESERMIRDSYSRLHKFVGAIGMVPREKVIRDGISFDPAKTSTYVNILLDGYFQSENYFFSIRDQILNEFRFREPDDRGFLEKSERLSASNTVAVHIRRGDYVSNSSANAHHEICSPEYYRQAIELMREKIPGAGFYVFSDDTEYARELFRNDSSIQIMRGDEKDAAYIDMCLMAKANHHIIANSSYSWWSGWLAQKASQVVIAPAKWYKTQATPDHLIPSGWIQL